MFETLFQKTTEANSVMEVMRSRIFTVHV